MKHLLPSFFPIDAITSDAGSEAARAIAENGEGATEFIINPYMGLIGLCVLIVTGAVAVIREIMIEEEENSL